VNMEKKKDFKERGQHYLTEREGSRKRGGEEKKEERGEGSLS